MEAKDLCGRVGRYRGVTKEMNPGTMNFGTMNDEGRRVNLWNDEG